MRLVFVLKHQIFIKRSVVFFHFNHYLLFFTIDERVCGGEGGGGGGKSCIDICVDLSNINETENLRGFVNKLKMQLRSIGNWHIISYYLVQFCY